MPNYTHADVMGNLTRDPELRYLPSGHAVADLTVAVNTSYTKESGEKVDRVDFLDVTLYKRLAEVAAEYLKKGRPVFVTGQLQQDRWEDSETGQKRSKVRIIGRQLQLLGRKDDESALQAPTGAETSKSASPKAAGKASPRKATEKVASGDDPFAQ